MESLADAIFNSEFDINSPFKIKYSLKERDKNNTVLYLKKSEIRSLLRHFKKFDTTKVEDYLHFWNLANYFRKLLQSNQDTVAVDVCNDSLLGLTTTN